MPKKPSAKNPLKAAVAKSSGLDHRLLDALKSLDEATLARVRDTIRAEMEFDEDPIGEAVELFDRFLDKLGGFAEPMLSEDDETFLEDLVLTLTQLSIEDNGGDPEAREARAEIYEMLDAAMASGDLDASNLVLVAKILNDSGWRVPESLKSAVVETLEAGPPTEGVEPSDLKSTLAEIAEAAEGDPFAAYDALNSVLVAFPAEAAARMVGALGENHMPVMLQALAGFAMHREEPIASAAIRELKLAAGVGAVESALVERLVRMRPWLPARRQGQLDEAIRALRSQARPPVEIERPKPVKCFVLACDGSGAGGTLASLKASDGWRFVAALGKPSGVEEVLSLEGAPKSHVDATVRDMRANVMAAQTDVAGISEYLKLALGENVASETPPPFKLIAFAENLGLGPIAPRAISPGDLIESILADVPQNEKDAAAIKRAHAAVVGGALDAQWFEAGEPIERLLGPIRGVKARAKTVLNAYLPERRGFWLRACALTAFVLQMDRKTYGALGRNLALVGRDLAADAPIENIPLMRQIAEMTVQAYQSRF